MKRKVQMTLTQDEYVHLVALKNYFGFKSLSETVSFAVQKEIASRQESSTYDTYNYYVEQARKEVSGQNSHPKKQECNNHKLDTRDNKTGLTNEQAEELRKQLEENQKLYEAGHGVY